MWHPGTVLVSGDRREALGCASDDLARWAFPIVPGSIIRTCSSRFNEEALRVMIVAQQITRGVGHAEIGTAELLVALAGDDYMSGRALARLGLSRRPSPPQPTGRSSRGPWHT